MHGMRLGLLMLLLMFVAVACKEEKKAKVIRVEEKKVEVPSFDGALAYRLVAEQVAYGPRVPGTPAHDSTAQWIVRQMRKRGLTVHVQRFVATRHDGVPLKGQNIVARYMPKLPNRLLLMAHWDTRYMSDMEEDESKRKLPVLGADDGASGVAVLIALADALVRDSVAAGVDFVFFDLEDQGAPNGDPNSWCLGSQYWSNNRVPSGYRATAGILLDMVGSEMAIFRRERYSEQFAPHINEKVWHMAGVAGYRPYFPDEVGPPILDDHVFVNQLARIPSINIIYTSPHTPKGFGTHWHTQKDNMDIISKEKLRAVGLTVLHYIMHYHAR